jgi:hypothetical protein
MQPDSNIWIVLPSVNVSVMAGMRPLGFISTNQLNKKSHIGTEISGIEYKEIGDLLFFLDIFLEFNLMNLVWEP